MSPGSETLLSELRRLNAAFPEGRVAIGDMAVLLHAINDGVEAAPASSIEAYLSLEHLSTVRDEVEVVRAPEAYKRRALLPNAQIDLYVERQHRLAVPYEDAHRYSTIVGGVRIACKEHLLILMIDAAIDPAAPADAEKHAQSIGTLAASLDDPRPDLLWPRLDTGRIALLREFGISTERIESLLRPELLKSEIDPERSDQVGDRAQAHNPAEATTRAPREWALKLQPNLDLLPARVSSEPFLEETTTIRELCTAAGMPYRYYVVPGKTDAKWCELGAPGSCGAEPIWYGNTAGWLYKVRGDGEGNGRTYLWHSNGYEMDGSMDYVDSPLAEAIIAHAVLCK